MKFGLGFGKDKSRCAHSHPVVKLGAGEFHGGIAADPKDELDVYVSLDWGTASHPSMYPWNHAQSGPVFVFFGISDMQAPKNLTEFRKMIEWLAELLRQGKRVHVGCLGGHGRTGMVLAALVFIMNKEVDPIGWVRENYCSRAVESRAQVDFLVKNYGAKDVLGSRASVKEINRELDSVRMGPYSYLKDFTLNQPSAAARRLALDKCTPEETSKLSIWG
jgi:hypothetical protein